MPLDVQMKPISHSNRGCDLVDIVCFETVLSSPSEYSSSAVLVRENSPGRFIFSRDKYHKLSFFIALQKLLIP